MFSDSGRREWIRGDAQPI